VSLFRRLLVLVHPQTCPIFLQPVIAAQIAVSLTSISRFPVRFRRSGRLEAHFRIALASRYLLVALEDTRAASPSIRGIRRRPVDCIFAIIREEIAAIKGFALDVYFCAGQGVAVVCLCVWCAVDIAASVMHAVRISSAVYACLDTPGAFCRQRQIGRKALVHR